MIANEMEECLEVLFVEQGRYDVGYEINKQKFWRRQFGESTVIGGFNICFNRRHFFIIRARTDLSCLAIRKEKFINLINQFPEFNYQIKQKFWSHYCQKTYQPLMKLKNMDIMDYNFRSDFKQVLYLQENSENLIAECMQDIFDYMKLIKYDNIKKQLDINNDLSEMMLKIESLSEIGMSITTKWEKLQMIFYDRQIRIILSNKIKEEKVLKDMIVK